jgi:hypothetical protein
MEKSKVNPFFMIGHLQKILNPRKIEFKSTLYDLSYHQRFQIKEKSKVNLFFMIGHVHRHFKSWKNRI